MKGLPLLITTIAIFSLFSCGPSAAEKAKMEQAKADSINRVEQMKADSIKTAMDATIKHTADSVKDAMEKLAKEKSDSVQSTTEAKMQDKYELQQSLADYKAQLVGMKNRLSIMNANLEVANDEMTKMKEWKMGRAKSEREMQIRNQSMKIQSMENSIAALKDRIQETNSKIEQTEASLKQH